MSFLFPPASSSSRPEEVWTTAFHQLGQRIRQHFVRQEPHNRALGYLRGLMSDVSRKNGWQLAEGRTHQALARLCHYRHRSAIASHLQL